MQVRQFGKSDFKASVLGFGAMRLPTTADGKIDEKAANEMLYYAIDQGVNYVDTAYVYHKGESEVWLGKALKGSYRDKVKLATKLPSWEIKEKSDFDKFFKIQLERLQTDRIDFYLLHSLNKNYWPALKNLGALEWAEDKIKKGQIGQLGFSFHDEYGTFEKIIHYYDWAFCQIQYNYIDIVNQAGVRGLKLAADKGVAVIVMEPLLGGRLVNPPEKIQRIWDTSPVKRTSTDWALQWLWSQKEVSLVLSGMSTLGQVKENVAYARYAEVDRLTKAELSLFEKVRKSYAESVIIPCTKCNYCMPCPQGVNIPRIFDIYNNGYMYDKMDAARGEYEWLAQAFKLGISKIDERALHCTECKSCEEKCPQNLRVADWIKVTHQVLGEKKAYVVHLD